MRNGKKNDVQQKFIEFKNYDYWHDDFFFKLPKIDKESYLYLHLHEHDNHQAIIKTIIDLATNLQMGTVGEGIENASDATLLQQMDCVYGQGYYFFKPGPAHEISAHLAPA